MPVVDGGCSCAWKGSDRQPQAESIATGFHDEVRGPSRRPFEAMCFSLNFCIALRPSAAYASEITSR